MQKSNKIERKTQIKKPEDPNAPNKPLNAFQIFCKILIPAIQESNPELATNDIDTCAADNWKNLGELEKAKFIQREEVEKERYDKEMEMYYQKKS